MCWRTQTASLARAQRSLGTSGAERPLWPPILDGNIEAAGPPAPLEIAFDLADLRPGYFRRITCGGLDQWQEVLPPLAPGLSMGEGGTALVSSRSLSEWVGVDDFHVKDESRNPTWSHKDRLNLCTVSAAVASGSRGIVIASSGNHGVSASAYAARAGLPCIIITSTGASAAQQAFMRAYGAAVVAVPTEARLGLLQQVVERIGFTPISSTTPVHTGHPFGTEGYKTIAYELFSQLGFQAPAVVLVPTGYAELLYGLHKGFCELRNVGEITALPKIVSCEPSARGPLAQALASGTPYASVAAEPTEALAIACTTSSLRGRLAVTQSGGRALTVDDGETRAAQRACATAGLWPEFSSAAAVAGARNMAKWLRSLSGPVVAIQTSCGFKDPIFDTSAVPVITPDLDHLEATLRDTYGMKLKRRL